MSKPRVASKKALKYQAVLRPSQSSTAFCFLHDGGDDGDPEMCCEISFFFKDWQRRWRLVISFLMQVLNMDVMILIFFHKEKLEGKDVKNVAVISFCKEPVNSHLGSNIWPAKVEMRMMVARMTTCRSPTCFRLHKFENVYTNMFFIQYIEFQNITDTHTHMQRWIDRNYHCCYE